MLWAHVQRVLLSVTLLFVAYVTLINMWKSNVSLGALVLSLGNMEASAQCGSASAISTAWYPPNASFINDLTVVVNGTKIAGLDFNTTFNFCNIPHVRATEYVVPPAKYTLRYVEVIQRHHKRTPYAANTFPYETYPWYCDDEALEYSGVSIPDSRSAQIAWSVYTSPINPFAPEGFNGTCQLPQITAQGLNDSRQHGVHLYGVYGDMLKFLPDHLDNSKIKYRVTNNVITSQVASQLILGMYPSTSDSQVRVAIQPNSIDSLEPTYSCPAADALYSTYFVGSSDPAWLQHLDYSVSLYNTLDNISGVNKSDPGWHNWFDHYLDNFICRLCHQKPLPCSAYNSSDCVTYALAEAVFKRGEYEYSFIYRDSPHSLAYSTARYGVWVAELATNLRAAMSGAAGADGARGVLYRHNVAHDGSLAPLLGILQVDRGGWPGFGDEVVFELYEEEASACWFVRVLWHSQVVVSKVPALGWMGMVPVSDLLSYFDGLVGMNASKMPGLCNGS